jgi:hypothetical protein
VDKENVKPRKSFQQLGIFIVATCYNTCIKDPISKTLLKLHEEQDWVFGILTRGFIFEMKWCEDVKII